MLAPLRSVGVLFDASFANISIDTIRANSTTAYIALVPFTSFYSRLTIDGENLVLYDALRKIGVRGLVNVNYIIRTSDIRFISSTVQALIFASFPSPGRRWRNPCSRLVNV
jgi:hypothetical protein